MAGATSFLTSVSSSGVVGFFVKGLGSKLIVYAVVLYAWTSLISWVISKLPNLTFDGLFFGLPDAFLWGLYYVDFGYILAAMITLEVTTMLIRLRKG
jgi:hypothetical protein